MTKPGKTVGADCLVLLKPAAPTIIHIPHASRVIPDDVRKFICLDDAALDKGGAPYIFHLKLHVSCAKNYMPGNIFRGFLNQKD